MRFCPKKLKLVCFEREKIQKLFLGEISRSQPFHIPSEILNALKASYKINAISFFSQAGRLL